jgi:hypothetical protein
MTPQGKLALEKELHQLKSIERLLFFGV